MKKTRKKIIIFGILGIFILSVQRGEAFSESFLEYFEMSPEEMWSRFKKGLLSTGNKGRYFEYK